MLYRRNAEPELSAELFADPPAEYRGAPFWSWNCRVTETLIDEQLEVFRRMGFGGAHLHPRTGLETPYMSEEFLDLVQHADETAAEKGMLCWLYDEDRYPSGAAGGMVTENVRFRARHLLLTRERKEDLCASREEFERRINAGEKPAGYYLTAYRVKTENGRMVSFRRLGGPAPVTDSPEETAGEGKLWLAYVELMRESPWFNDQTYIDVMNRKAVERFIELTHDRYAQRLGDEFGRSIPAIFTDEPQLKGSMVLSDGESSDDVTLSFTDDLPETFEAAYGVNLLDVLPELIWEKPAGEYSVHRLHYHDHLSERFVSAYSDTIAAWCEQHGLAMTGHYMSEPTLYSQTLRLGEAMRCYRNQQLPGIDILCGDPEYTTVKQAVSVARQNGREGVLSELYGVTNWDHDFKGHKLQGDWQAALGVTVRVPHLAFMSMEGEAKRDWPASIGYQSPWWEEYSRIENYFSRVNTAMTRGRALPCVAVIHPIESYWICYGPQAQTGDRRSQMDENFRNLTSWLLFGLVDFDFISESLLPGQRIASKEVHNNDAAAAAAAGGADAETSGRGEGREGPGNPAGRPGSSLPDARLHVGQMAYRTVIVPNLLTIRSSTLDALEELAHAGGNVIFTGEVPQLVDGRPSDRAAQLAKRTRVIPFTCPDLLDAVGEDRRIEIRMKDGSRCGNLFYQLREDAGCRWLFLCHVVRKRNRCDQSEKMTLRIRGRYRILRYDALTGEIHPQAFRLEGGDTLTELAMYPEDSLLFRLIPEEAGAAAQREAALHTENGTEEAGSSCKPAPAAAEEASEAGAEGGRPLRSGPRKTFYPLISGVSYDPDPAPVRIRTFRRPDAVRRTEPNVLLLDQARWRLDGGDWEPGAQETEGRPETEEILRLDNRIRGIAGYPRRQDAYTQPWRITDAPKEHLVELRYQIRSETEIAPEDALFLAMERPGEAQIFWNGSALAPVDEGKLGWFTDSFIRKVPLSGLHRGMNELFLRIPYGRKTNLENLYLLGDFGVRVRGTTAAVVDMPENLLFGDVTRQELPFYGGSLIYEMKFTLERARQAAVHVPRFSAPVLGVALDHVKRGVIAFAPHRLELGEISAGEHVLTVCAYGNRFNCFGTLHNANDEYKWYGPDSYRTAGDEWTYGWELRPFGILSGVELTAGQEKERG